MDASTARGAHCEGDTRVEDVERANRRPSGQILHNLIWVAPVDLRLKHNNYYYYYYYYYTLDTVECTHAHVCSKIMIHSVHVKALIHLRRTAPRGISSHFAKLAKMFINFKSVDFTKLRRFFSKITCYNMAMPRGAARHFSSKFDKNYIFLGKSVARRRAALAYLGLNAARVMMANIYDCIVQIQ